MRWLVGIAGAIVCLSATTAGAADLYVDNLRGSDAFNGGSPEHVGLLNGPTRTVRAAMRKVVPGGRIVLVPSGLPYREPVLLDGSVVRGFSRAPIVLEGNGQEISGYEPIDPARWKRHPDGYWQLLSGLAWRGVLAEDGRPLERASADRWRGWPSLEVGQYAVWQDGLLLRLPKGEPIRDHAFVESARPAGIVIDRCSNLVLRNLRIRGFALDAVHVRGPARNVRFEKCLFADCGRSGLAVRGAATVSVEDSFFEGVPAAVLADDVARVTLDSCEVPGGSATLVADATSSIKSAGDAPAPLPVGTVVDLPDHERMPKAVEKAAPASAARTAAEPKAKEDSPKKKPSFFDDE